MARVPTASQLDAVAATGLVVAGEPLVVMLSGGRDSVCLLEIAQRLGADVTALHVNHGLRGDESRRDEAHCRELCAGLDASLEVVAADDPPTGNVQAWARDRRYAAAAALADAVGGRVASAHTATDQVETVLYRLAASPGRSALLGMPVSRGILVRPLLAAGLWREDTGAYCRQRGLPFRDDASNGDPRYARSRVREGLVPAMLAVDRRAAANVLRTVELLRDEAEVLDALVAEQLCGRDAVAVADLRAIGPALARLVVRALAQARTGASGARAAARLDEILALGDDGMLDVGEGARAVVADGELSFAPSPAPPDAAPQ